MVPAPVLVEVDYWCRKLLTTQVWSQFVEDVAAGAYRLRALTANDCVRAAELEAQYGDLRLGLVDAAVIVSCERLGERKVATLDRRHFSVVRPSHCDALTLLPD